MRFWHWQDFPHCLHIHKNKGPLCAPDPKLKYVTSVEKGKRGMFQFMPNEMFQQRLLWFQRQPFARTSNRLPWDAPAQRRTPQPCKQDFYTLRQNEIIFCHWDYSRRAFVLCLSRAQEHIALLYIQEKKKKENARYNRKGSQLPVFTYRAEGLLIIHIIHSPPPWMCFSVRGDMNCLLGCSLK